MHQRDGEERQQWRMEYVMRIFSSPSLMLMRLRVKNDSDFKEEQSSSRGFTAMMSHPARSGVGGRDVGV